MTSRIDQSMVNGLPASITAIDGRLDALEGGGGTFVSSEQIITASGTLSIAHGLGATPTFVSVKAVCKTAEAGYSVNDEVFVGFNDGAAVSTGLAVFVDATNIGVKFASATATITVTNKSTGANAQLTNANWRLKFAAKL